MSKAGRPKEYFLPPRERLALLESGTCAGLISWVSPASGLHDRRMRGKTLHRVHHLKISLEATSEDDHVESLAKQLTQFKFPGYASRLLLLQRVTLHTI